VAGGHRGVRRGCPPPHWDRVWRGLCSLPHQRNIFEFSSKNVGSYTFLLQKTTFGQEPRLGLNQRNWWL